MQMTSMGIGGTPKRKGYTAEKINQNFSKRSDLELTPKITKKFKKQGIVTESTETGHRIITRKEKKNEDLIGKDYIAKTWLR